MGRTMPVTLNARIKKVNLKIPVIPQSMKVIPMVISTLHLTTCIFIAVFTLSRMRFTAGKVKDITNGTTFAEISARCPHTFPGEQYQVFPSGNLRYRVSGTSGQSSVMTVPAATRQIP